MRVYILQLWLYNTVRTVRKKSQLITIVTNSVLETGFHWKFVSTGWENENIFHFHWTVSLRSSIPGRLESSHMLIFLPKVVRKSKEVKSASWFSWVSQRERERGRQFTAGDRFEPAWMTVPLWHQVSVSMTTEKHVDAENYVMRSHRVGLHTLLLLNRAGFRFIRNVHQQATR